LKLSIVVVICPVYHDGSPLQVKAQLRIERRVEGAADACATGDYKADYDFVSSVLGD
jgi:hypothetical protein